MNRFAKQLLAFLIPHRFKRLFQESLFMALGLKWQLASGLRIEVKSPTDWSLLCDIFLDGEYDDSIRMLVKRLRAKEIVTVVNLGANVGFFELRLFQLFQRNGHLPSQLKVYAIEPDGENIAEYHRRIGAAAQWRERITMIQGLVGRQKTGDAAYWASHQHHACTALAERRYAGSWRMTVPCVDVESVLGPQREVDLLKCDIEGAESDFVKAYPGLLQRVAIVVMEIHDPAHLGPIRDAMTKAGLSLEQVIADHHGANSVRIFYRTS